MSKSITLPIVVLGIIAVTCSGAGAALSDFIAGTFTDPATGASEPYRLFVPLNYDPAKEYPLTLFMHGAGEVGTNNTSQVGGNINNLVAHVKMPQYETFLLCPQTTSTWSSSTTNIALMEYLQTQYSIDRSRLYVTGLSLGGSGVFTHIQQQPHYFAAAVPICGATVVNKAYLMKDQNIWSFHGGADTTVYPDSDRDTMAAVSELGGDAIYTEYPGAGHGIWGTVYNTNAMYDWMFAQRGEGREVDSIRPRSGPLLKYDKQDLGGGKFAYTFWIYNEDTWQMPYQVNLAFRGIRGATVQEMKYFGAVPVTTQADADIFNGQGTPAYDKTQDSWAIPSWQALPGTNPFDGSAVSGAVEGSNMFAMSLYSGSTSTLWTNVQVAHIVVDGDVEWAGSIYRYDTYYDVAGTTRDPGDFNGDGVVDQADYTAWADTYASEGPGLTADANDDGVVNQADYTTWADHFGDRRGAMPVPEPASLALLALCGPMLLRARRN